MIIRPIGHIHTDFSEKFGIPRQSGLADNISTVIIESPYNDMNAFMGIEEYSHIWLIWGFSENVAQAHDMEEKNSGAEKNADKSATLKVETSSTYAATKSVSWSPTVRPPRLGGNARKGVFATRSPFRPNSLGLSVVELLGIKCIDGNPVLTVKGADMLDGTPIYDIKPYLPYSEIKADARGGFAAEKACEKLEVILEIAREDFLEKGLTDKDIEIVSQILSQDPRPHYQHDPERIYGMKYKNFDIKFKVNQNILTVIDVE